ncbi:hypothetical protein [Borreliella garinii]|uniref:hypothetical protein n=1 Tax=Borreliella garinii TaxID=29519 RepID=UPI001AEE3F3B|nr:hypothetical protein [Borreliella garinii]
MYSLSQGNNLSLMLQLLLSFIKAYYLILNSSSHKSMPTPHSVAVPLYQKKFTLGKHLFTSACTRWKNITI